MIKGVRYDNQLPLRVRGFKNGTIAGVLRKGVHGHRGGAGDLGRARRGAAGEGMEVSYQSSVRSLEN